VRAVPPVRSLELKGGRRWGGLLLLLFALALLLRLAPLLELSDLPTFRRLVMDAARYDELSRNLLAGGWLPAEPFYQAPLYPYFLACIYTVFGIS
jgi:predicted membrane-bound mannosyltransferase